jgi:putative methyltransferase (TIGR04325 family)
MMCHNKSLTVLDYGGGLASTFFRNYDIINGLGFTWTIIEQDHIVKVADKLLHQIPNLKFLSVSDFKQQDNVDYEILIFGSSLQFMEKPKNLLASLYHDKLCSIIFEQIPFMENGPTRLTIQKVKEPIYNASYPAWHFNEDELKSWIDKAFTQRFRSVNPHVTNSFGNYHSRLMDMVYTRKTS